MTQSRLVRLGWNYPTAGHRSKTNLIDDVKQAIVRSRLWARNTVEYWTEGDWYHFRFHDTDILSIDPKGEIHISTRGFNTTTTMNRLNGKLAELFPYDHKTKTCSPGLNQSKYLWYFTDITGKVIPFEDSVHLNKRGKIIRSGVKQCREYIGKV